MWQGEHWKCWKALCTLFIHLLLLYSIFCVNFSALSRKKTGSYFYYFCPNFTLTPKPTAFVPNYQHLWPSWDNRGCFVLRGLLVQSEGLAGLGRENSWASSTLQDLDRRIDSEMAPLHGFSPFSDPPSHFPTNKATYTGISPLSMGSWRSSSPGFGPKVWGRRSST